ncbi:RcnB family protein [Sphingomonas montana]|uniref:RcnB family protein n=1 Tax=Sphingomonas montana TaxID=1843236 RepID=UPI00096FED43|nr:RcnB family protein [Sphingomonas montana]
MRKFLIAGLMALTLAPAMAAAQPGELRRDRQDIREEQRELRQAQRYGSRRDIREERRDVRDARQEYREDWRQYRQQNRRVFTQGRYVGPNRNWRYRPVAVGYQFQPSFYGQRYVIADPYRYRLPRATGINRWVRYGNDVVLVNTRNGRVVQVYNSFFY